MASPVDTHTNNSVNTARPLYNSLNRYSSCNMDPSLLNYLTSGPRTLATLTACAAQVISSRGSTRWSPVSTLSVPPD
ncbi:hypothetical protein RRG08_064146 [Elysia crispata]|uniref:Uncharacterized protein n=1 Tax=Elysia crispata TaxID=231223 RepID=A0AAE0ZLY5_9GAST|nr:hypothetical protein RRG08_064146 [Elysia crispata]